MGSLSVSIDQLINSLGKVKFYQPIIECITNSLEAKSQNITVELFSVSRKETAYEEDRFFNKVIITDDGEGFSDINFKAFKEYRTKHKIHLGCKGVGRLTWLKIFNKAEIQSVVWEDDKILKKEFVFDEQFDLSLQPKITELDKKTLKPKTSVILSDIKDESLSVPEDIEKVRDVVLIELLPKLLLINRNFNITFRSEHPGIEIKTIKTSDLPKLHEKSFKVENGLIDYSFTLKYSLPNGKKDKIPHRKVYAYHCANNRTVEAFDNKGLTVNLSVESGQYGVFLLESKLFDTKVNDIRNKIQIGNDTDSNGNISWDQINAKLRPVLTEIIYKKWNHLRDQAEKDKESLAEENPHLTPYIKRFDVVGRLEPREALKVAERSLESAKKQIRSKYKELLLKHKIEENNVQEFQQLAASTTELGKQELAEYIWYRKVVIEVMEKLIDRKEKQEEVIHNLIMPMKTNDKERVEDNNLWLLDDKFSLYQYAASDLEINEIYKDVCRELYPDGNNAGRKDRPDLCIFFSDSKDSKDDLEAVIIELKKFTANKFDKSKGLDQLGFYAKLFRQRNPRFKKFWVYLVVDSVDDDFETILSVRGYQRFFCQNGTAYLHYIQLDGAQVHQAVFTMDALTANAKARNHKFLEIIKSSIKDKP